MQHLDVKTAIKLLSSKKTTIAEMCKFLFADIQVYQDERERFHLQNLKEEYQLNPTKLTSEILENHALWVAEKINKEVKEFTSQYARQAIDDVLDALNSKQIKNKPRAYDLIALLDQMKASMD